MWTHLPEHWGKHSQCIGNNGSRRLDSFSALQNQVLLPNLQFLSHPVLLNFYLLSSSPDLPKLCVRENKYIRRSSRKLLRKDKFYSSTALTNTINDCSMTFCKKKTSVYQLFLFLLHPWALYENDFLQIGFDFNNFNVCLSVWVGEGVKKWPLTLNDHLFLYMAISLSNLAQIAIKMSAFY